MRRGPTGLQNLADEAHQALGRVLGLRLAKTDFEEKLALSSLGDAAGLAAGQPSDYGRCRAVVVRYVRSKKLDVVEVGEFFDECRHLCETSNGREDRCFDHADFERGIFGRGE